MRRRAEARASTGAKRPHAFRARLASLCRRTPRDRHRECRPPTLLGTLGVHRAPMQVEDPGDQGETEAHAVDRAGRRAICQAEGLEEVPGELIGDAYNGDEVALTIDAPLIRRRIPWGTNDGVADRASAAARGPSWLAKPAHVACEEGAPSRRILVRGRAGTGGAAIAAPAEVGDPCRRRPGPSPESELVTRTPNQGPADAGSTACPPDRVTPATRYIPLAGTKAFEIRTPGSSSPISRGQPRRAGIEPLGRTTEKRDCRARVRSLIRTQGLCAPTWRSTR